MEKNIGVVLKPLLEIRPLLDKKSYVVKSNILVEARYRLSLQESQVILWLLTQIRPEDDDFKVHKLNIIEFAHFTQVEPGNKYSGLRRITKQLIQRVIEIHETDTDDILQVAWLSSARYQSKQGYVLLEFSPQLKPYLLQLKSHFTKISIVDTLKLKSIYGIRIFELLLQYNSIGSREISINDLRSYCGILAEEYKDYFDLKRKVIEKAKTEINGKTEYLIDYKEIKESRKVVAIKWTIQKKNLEQEARLKKMGALQKELRSETALIEAIMEYGFGRPTAKKFITLHGEEVVKKAVGAVNLQVERGHAKNPKAMLQIAIKEQWNPNVFKNRKVKA